ncbi:hypothetical protein [Sphingobacterium sp.]|uniref:hypothetical protein n=1 Tax=Sphingobacterium sp. TaxID=341027 RepID=UPI0031E30A47
MKTKPKKKYVAPRLAATSVAMEASIAAGSANVQPTNSNQEVKSEWNNEGDKNGSMAW